MELLYSFSRDIVIVYTMVSSFTTLSRPISTTSQFDQSLPSLLKTFSSLSRDHSLLIHFLLHCPCLCILCWAFSLTSSHWSVPCLRPWNSSFPIYIHSAGDFIQSSSFKCCHMQTSPNSPAQTFLLDIQLTCDISTCHVKYSKS